MKKAVIELAGNQYLIQEGDTITTNVLPDSLKGKQFSIEKVLLLHDGNTTTIGTPYIQGAVVKGEVTRNYRGKKVIVFRYKSKVRRSKKRGYRHTYSEVKIKTISS